MPPQWLRRPYVRELFVRIGQTWLAIFFPCLAVWLFALAAALYVKWQVLTHGGFRQVGRLLGRLETTDGAASRAYLFSLPERLSFFRLDLFWLGILVPLLGTILLYFLPARWRLYSVIVAAFGVIIFLALQLHGYWYVGQFQSWGLWVDAIQWGLRHPEDARQYSAWGISMKLALGLFLLVTVGLLLQFKIRHPHHLSTIILKKLAIFCGLFLLLLTSAAWCVPGAGTAYHQSSLWMCFKALLSISDVDMARYASLDAPQLLAKWRQITRSPSPLTSPAYYGAAADYDVICFVMETAPARCVDLPEDLALLPNVSQLSRQAWIADKHFSSYPYTRRALFSLVTAWYPTDTEYFDSSGKSKHTPGLMQSLAQCGYITAAYKSDQDNPDDELLQHSEGINHLVWGQKEAIPADAAGWRIKARADRSALAALKQDIRKWTATNQRYAVMYLPQIGHAPWGDIRDDGRSRSTIACGRAIIQLQDQWLGEIISVLKSVGRLDRTLILFTGDHGVRTRREDPDFEGGVISSYSFRVPFLLYAPGVLSRPQTISWQTSHIDVTPSLLDLLGVSENRAYEIGSPIWDSRLENRILFLWAGIYLGADGFYDKGVYHMWQRVSDLTYCSNRLEFKDASPLPRGSLEDVKTRELITDGLAIQYRLTRLVSY